VTPATAHRTSPTSSWVKSSASTSTPTTSPPDPDRNYAIPADNPFVGVTGDDEIWAYGLRNPFRASFDRETGEFWIGDVGQGNIEEVDFQPADSPGGENYGWRCYEGFPALQYRRLPRFLADHRPRPSVPALRPGQPFRCSITGGVAYRGCSLYQHTGWYFFADYCSGEVFRLSIDRTTGDTQEVVEITDELGNFGGNPVAFAEDLEGEIYIVSLNGNISKIVPAPSVNPCLDNCAVPCNPVLAFAEPCDQATFADITAFLSSFNDQDPIADLAAPFGDFTFADISDFLTLFINGCP
jgi:glucose/arabinose dehydrogenase